LKLPLVCRNDSDDNCSTIIGLPKLAYMKSVTSHKTPVAAAAVEHSLSLLSESYYVNYSLIGLALALVLLGLGQC